MKVIIERKMKHRQLWWGVLLLMFLFNVTTLSAQQRLKFSVLEFSQDAFDLSAQSEETKKIDGSGSLYAIIKVTSDNPDDDLRAYQFNFGNMNHLVEDHDDQLWLYVQKNAKQVTITRQGYTPVRNYDLRTTIEAGRNYVMRLSAQGPVIYTQMVMFSIQPADSKAVVMIQREGSGQNREMLGIIDETGGVAKNMELGTYTYEVVAENYYPSEGRFTLQIPSETHTESIVLRSNGAKVTLKAGPNVEIFVNGTKRGTGSLTGVLKAGNHTVECRQANHRPSQQTITIEEGKEQTIQLTPPTPITGTLSVNSRPLGASIQIDGTDYGATPKNIANLLIGHHQVTVSKDGYASKTEECDIHEDETLTLEMTLVKKADSSPQQSVGESSNMNTAVVDAKQYPFRRVGKCPITDKLNPMDGGIILGWTTIAEAVAEGGVSKPRKDTSHTIDINHRTYWDHEGDGIIKSLYFVVSDGVPEQWAKAGLSFTMSYNQWLDWFKKNDFTVAITSGPHSGSSFNAKLTAENLSKNLCFELNFAYGKGQKASDPNTLYSITLERKRIRTLTTDYSPYLPIDGVTPGVTTANQLPQLGIELTSGYKWGCKGNRTYFYDDNKKIYKIEMRDNRLPSEWVKPGESVVMTYNRWLQFFRERGFLITKNEPSNEPNSRYPEIEAMHPQIGIRIGVKFHRSFNITTEGDNSDSELLWYYDIRVL